MSEDRHPLFLPLLVGGGLVEGFGLAASGMARPEIVLDFLRLADLGLLVVMAAAAAVVGGAVLLVTRWFDRAPLTGDPYGRREKLLDRTVLAGGALFGVGWGISGICPGAAYASLGTGNLPILWGIAGMLVGAYAQGYWRSGRDEAITTPVTSD